LSVFVPRLFGLTERALPSGLASTKKLMSREVRGGLVPTFLKTCPKCGKRFEIERVSETVTKDDTALPEEKSTTSLGGRGVAYAGLPATTSVSSGKVDIDEVYEKDDYTDTYKCKHCGNTWTETREKMKDLGRIEGSGHDIG
jgi:ribosomal protein L37AE/L43A